MMRVDLTTTGILQEGNRDLNRKDNTQDADEISAEIRECSEICSLLQIFASCSTFNTVTYRRVSQFFESVSVLIQVCQLGKDLKLLRTVQISRSKSSLILPGVKINPFGGRVLHIQVQTSKLHRMPPTWDPTPSLADVSAFENEKEFILNLDQLFHLGKVRWEQNSNR
jgi:hypothetical protein